jgi:hypothetical protein
MTSKKSYQFIIVGSENCNRCQILQEKLPEAYMVKIPNFSLGFGDSFAKLTNVLSIPSCHSCKIRRSFLNYCFPYFWKTTKEVRDARNAVLRLGHECLPVLLDKSYNFIHDVDEYFPKFKEQYMND